jgi:hypothetical protein
MYKRLVLCLCLSTLGLVADARASISDCQNVYVGRIWIERGYGLFGVVFLNNPGDPSGSYWQYFTTWSADDRKSALSTLTSAKLTQHRVHVETDEPGGCSIHNGNRYVKSVTLANEP